jgi:glycosyltransferase involved in cell wall biosynthesis
LGAKWLLLIEPDELFDASVTPAYIARLVNHPDPQVLGYDCGLITHYNSLNQIRADGSRGTSMEKGPSGVRLVRYIEGRTRPAIAANGHGVTISPLLSEESVRAANIRIRKLDMLRPEDRLHVQETSESIAVYAYHNETRIGFHCLCYNRENLDDMGRWLDIATGLCDESVVVWTDEEAPSTAWSMLFGFYGVKVVHHPLNDNLAAARNAGLDALSDKLTWAWFIDPDEWFSEPLQDAKAIRRMAESVRYGYLFQTCNYRGDKPPSISDSVRMSRLQRGIRMDGRVHEGFGDSWKRLQAQGIHPRLVYAPFVVQHRGMAFSAERMREKLDKYERLLRLELADRPENPGAWTSLAFHLFNDGAMDEGYECLRRGVACGGTSYLPYREMAYWHLRQAQSMLDQSIERLSDSHQWANSAKELRTALLKHVEPFQPIDRDTSRVVAPLPKFRDFE